MIGSDIVITDYTFGDEIEGETAARPAKPGLAHNPNGSAGSVLLVNIELQSDEPNNRCEWAVGLVNKIDNYLRSPLRQGANWVLN